MISSLTASSQAREHRKELDLEFFGSDAELEGESDSDEEAHRVKAKEKWNTKIFARVEKMSDAKFLDFCEEQRSIVNDIWVGDNISILT